MAAPAPAGMAADAGRTARGRDPVGGTGSNCALRPCQRRRRQGNLKVFAEIGRLFAAFAAACLDDPAYDAAKIAAFCAELRPGPPPDGQEYLRRAFAGYYAALFAADTQGTRRTAALRQPGHRLSRADAPAAGDRGGPRRTHQRPAHTDAAAVAAVLPYPGWVARALTLLAAHCGPPAAGGAPGRRRRDSGRAAGACHCHRPTDDPHLCWRGLSAPGA